MQFRGPDRFFVVVINLIIKEPVPPFCLCSKMNNLNKWLRWGRDAVPAKAKFQGVRLPNPTPR
jgi:hypothetical protein